MTRQRDNRNDWTEFSAKRKAQELVARKAMALGTAGLTDEERAVLDSSDKPRAKPVQYEDAEMDHLAVLVDVAWWEPGFQRFEHRGDGGKWSDIKGGRKRKQQGAKPGWPDCGLVLPPRVKAHEGLASIPMGWKLRPDGLYQAPVGISAYCEVKAEHVRPKRALPELWWVGVKTEFQVADGEYTRFIMPHGARFRNGVSAWQIYWLDLLHRSGHATYVAYGAEDAFAWLDAQAGPKPKVLPW